MRCHRHRTPNCRIVANRGSGTVYRRCEDPLFLGVLVFLAGCREFAASGWIGVAGATRLAGLLRVFRLGRSRAGCAADHDTDQGEGRYSGANSEQGRLE